MKFIERFDVLAGEHQEILIACEEGARRNDPHGVCTASLRSIYRFLGIHALLRRDDLDVCRDQIRKATVITLDLFRRAKAGQDISVSYLTMTGSYQRLLDALAFGLLQESVQLGQEMGMAAKDERAFDHIFDRSFGNILMHLIRGNIREARTWNLQFNNVLTDSKYKNEQGYAVLTTSIIERSSSQFRDGMAEVLIGHRNLASRGRWKDSEDELICIWGMGFLNLARHFYGMEVDVCDPLLPDKMKREVGSNALNK